MASAGPALSVAIVGGSIGGLAAAVAFHRLGAQVRVFEKSPTVFKGRGGSLGFCQVPLWEALRDAPMMRRGQRAHRGQGGWIYGDLWTFLYEGLPDGTVTFNSTVADLGPDPNTPTIDGQKYDLAIVADGGWSTLRGLYFERTLPVYAGYEVYRFRVELDQVKGFRHFGEYTEPPYATILLDICQNEGPDFVMGGTTVPTEESKITRPSAAVNRQAAGDAAADADGADKQAWFLDFYEKTFGSVAHGELLRVMKAAAKKGKLTPLPQFEFEASNVVAGRIILLGDAAHMASPRTASGAHTAVLDAFSLFEVFSAALASKDAPGNLEAAIARGLQQYAPLGLARAKQLVARSRQVAAGVVAPGFRRAEQQFVPASRDG